MCTPKFEEHCSGGIIRLRFIFFQQESFIGVLRISYRMHIRKYMVSGCPALGNTKIDQWIQMLTASSTH